MTDDLVQRVARAMWMADPDPYDPADRRPFEEADWEAQRNYRAEARAAVALCMEEAADAVGEVGDHAEVGAYINAIRALIKEPQP